MKSIYLHLVQERLKLGCGTSKTIDREEKAEGPPPPSAEIVEKIWVRLNLTRD